MDKVDAICRIFGCKRSDLMEERGDTGYYSIETLELAETLFENPDLHALMKAATELKKDVVPALTDMLKTMKETNPEG